MKLVFITFLAIGVILVSQASADDSESTLTLAQHSGVIGPKLTDLIRTKRAVKKPESDSEPTKNPKLTGEAKKLVKKYQKLIDGLQQKLKKISGPQRALLLKHLDFLQSMVNRIVQYPDANKIKPISIPVSRVN